VNIPGFVDLQVNGYKGVDFSSPDLTADSFARASRELLTQGTAAFLPTLITCPEEVYRRNLAIIGQACAQPEFEGRLLGIHVEGPFLSRAPGAVGAHNPAYVRDPDPQLLDRMQQWAGGRIRMITVAADAPGAEELVRDCGLRIADCGLKRNRMPTARLDAASSNSQFAIRNPQLNDAQPGGSPRRLPQFMGITVSLGHHMANEEQLGRMARAGARALTHLGNGVPAMLPRHPNPIWAGLACDDLAALVIADGHHLPPSVLKTILRTKGVARTIVTSDQTAVAGLAPGRYHAFGTDVVLEESGRLYVPDKGCLAGSSATMLVCMNHLASLGLLTLEEMEQVGYFNPLRLIGVDPRAIRSPNQLAYDDARAQFVRL
jgi:N-acetylglucosamine-6-phosphate deacetylase